MTLFDYIERHPWWTLVYLWTFVVAICAWKRVTFISFGKEGS